MKPTYTELQTSLNFLRDNCPSSKFKDLSLETLQQAIDIIYPKDHKIKLYNDINNDKDKKYISCKYIKKGNNCPYKNCDYKHDIIINDKEIILYCDKNNKYQNNKEINIKDKSLRDIKIKQNNKIIENNSNSILDNSLTQYNDNILSNTKSFNTKKCRFYNDNNKLNNNINIDKIEEASYSSSSDE